MTVAKLLARLFLLALAVSAATAHAQSPAATPDDREISVGRWDVASVEMNGRPVDPELLAVLQVIYRPDGSWAVLFKRLPVAEGTSTYRQDESPQDARDGDPGEREHQAVTLHGDPQARWRHAGALRSPGWQASAG